MKYGSKQYELSEQLLDIVMDLEINQEEVSKFLEMDFDDYLQLECGSLQFSIEDYKQGILKLENYPNKLHNQFMMKRII